MLVRLAPINAVEAEFAQLIYNFLYSKKGFPFTASQIARKVDSYPNAVKPMLRLMIDRGYVQAVQCGPVYTYCVPVSETMTQVKKVDVEAAFKPLSQEYIRMITFRLGKA